MWLLSWSILCFIILQCSVGCYGDLILLTRNRRDNTAGPADITDPSIEEMKIFCNVSNRFAITKVASKVKNLDSVSRQKIYSVVLPNSAYISGFVMEIGGKKYEAYVRAKEEALKLYNEAKSSGQAAALVEATVRDANRFTVSVNIEPQASVVLELTYEELLQRQNDRYEVIINIHPGQVVKDLTTSVLINELSPIKFVTTPELRSGSKIPHDESLMATKKTLHDNTAFVFFHPGVEQQKRLESKLKGISGQFVVQYDVDRMLEGGELLMDDENFVHFFSIDNKKAISTHVVFVLDSSGSMDGKIRKVEEAMLSILKQTKADNLISIIDFNSCINVWNIVSKSSPYHTCSAVDENRLPEPAKTTPSNLQRAKDLIQQGIKADKLTHMLLALNAALKLSSKAKSEHGDKYQTLVVLLTDGYPTDSETEEIIQTITGLNDQVGAAIYTLAFGEEADKYFLRELAERNKGSYRHIYDDTDADLQLQYFYDTISNLLLSDIKFRYSGSVSELTKNEFPNFFEGGELVVAGKLGHDKSLFSPQVSYKSDKGSEVVIPPKQRSKAPLQRLWAYKTIRETLEKSKRASSVALTDKALKLALDYSFVTDVTSMVVVKPNNFTGVIDPEPVAGPAHNRKNQRTTNIQDPRVQSTGFHQNDDDNKSIEELYPWIKQHLTSDGRVSISTGEYGVGNFELGENMETGDFPFTACKNGILWANSQCCLLKDCIHNRARISSFDNYHRKQQATEWHPFAKTSGQAAVLVEAAARDADRFTVSVNIEPQQSVVLGLIYEELLQRQNSQYEIVMNIHPGEVVKDLTTSVLINELSPIKMITTPELRSGSEIPNNGKSVMATQMNLHDKMAYVVFKPRVEQQEQLGSKLHGMSGQFVVQYDVDRTSEGGELLMDDENFVHFFSIEKNETLPTHVVFVLDSSGSMDGKIRKVEEAMLSILKQIGADNLISIIDFNSCIDVWSIVSTSSPYHTCSGVDENRLLKPVKTTSSNLQRARELVQQGIKSDGETYMLLALNTALKLSSKAKSEHGGKYKAIIVLLTDGEPTDSKTEEILRTITDLNRQVGAWIYTLAFGEDADDYFLRKLAEMNKGSFKHIYDDRDADLQLKYFYDTISNLLLADINFAYSGGAGELTKNEFPSFFEGGELVVAGKLGDDKSLFAPQVSYKSDKGVETVTPSKQRSKTPLVRLWAYKTIRETLEKSKRESNATALTDKALKLALDYSFVTDVTSMVVVKPNNDMNVIDPEPLPAPAHSIYHIPQRIPALSPGLVPNPPRSSCGSVYFTGFYKTIICTSSTKIGIIL